MKHFFSGLTLILTLLISPLYAAETIKLPGSSTTTTLPQKLLIEMAKRAGLTPTFPFENEQRIQFTRITNAINNDDLDIMFTATSRDYEEQFQALYFPIYRGMLGMRIGIVRHDNTDVFANVESLADLQKIKAGQGKHWTDTEILKENGIPVVETLKYPNLFAMLEGGRFAYFPRGIHEPWNEIENFKSLNLTVEPNLLINYKLPMYFFVKKSNTRLAQKLTAVLNDMVADGTFERLFFADNEVKNAIKKSNLGSRLVIELNNPFLTEKTPLSRSELWFDPMAGI